MKIINIYIKYCQYIDEKPYYSRWKIIKKSVISNYIKHLITENIDIERAKIKQLNHFLCGLEHLAPSTYNNSISILKEFYSFLYYTGYVDVDWGLYLRNKKLPKMLPKNIPLSLMLQLCTPSKNEEQYIKKSAIWLRKQAIVEFLFSSGVRGCELRSAKVKNLSSDLTECYIQTKKQGVPRFVYLGQPAREALADYLKARRINYCQPNKREREKYIFVTRGEKKLSQQTLTELVKRCAVQRIEIPITPHMIRHTFATEMLRATDNLRAVQILLGHAKISSTELYCHLEIHDRMKAVELYHPRSSAKKLKFDK